MKPSSIPLLILSLVMATPVADAQTDDEEILRAREEKIRTILTIQDLRTPHDALLRQYLYDPDTLVRVQATLAFGSLQDTSAMEDLVNNLSGGPPVVQEAAAFAIGQTGLMLSDEGRAGLAHDLIWIRAEQMSDPGVLLEEIGKWGDEQALTDIMLKFGDEPGNDPEKNFMCIARFGIRGITTPGAVQRLVAHLKNAPSKSWKAAYALQRIGNHEEVRAESGNLVPLAGERDPLIRMNIASLFGKLGEEPGLLDPLQRLAGFDRDWRVRVNALRALGNFPAGEEIAETFWRAFSHRDLNIALTAIAAFGSMTIPDSVHGKQVRRAFSELERLAENSGRKFRWQLQSASALALAKLRGAEAMDIISPRGGEHSLLLAGLITAMGATGSSRALGHLLAYTDPRDPFISRSALEALLRIARANPTDPGVIDTVYAENLKGLRSGDMAVTTAAASNLGDSLLMSTGSVMPLLDALHSLIAPADIEAIQEVCRTLGKIGDRGAVPGLEKYLDSRDAAVARAAAEALTVITGDDHGKRIEGGLEPLHSDLDFGYLENLPDTIGVWLETSEGNIRIDFYKRLAPFTIINILKLAGDEGFYNGLIFHRVVPNFVVQGGDPRGDGWGGPGYSIRSEFSPFSYGAGSVGIASAGKDTEGSQFFITHSPQPHLDGRYTVIGKVVSGMSVVNRIQVGDRIRGFSQIR